MLREVVVAASRRRPGLAFGIHGMHPLARHDAADTREPQAELCRHRADVGTRIGRRSEAQLVVIATTGLQGDAVRFSEGLPQRGRRRQRVDIEVGRDVATVVAIGLEAYASGVGA